VLTFEQIKELLELVSAKGLAGLEVERSGFRLRIEGAPRAVASAGASGGTEAALETTAARPATAQAGETAAQRAEGRAPGILTPPIENSHVLTSPIVGTFYTAPSPDAEPFVAVGDRVRRGQVLCIVEAMKLMNEIESDVAGVIVEVLPKNAQPVEFGEPLFAIRVD
jgi:acetyl-CoA carboxylase biotin carboxyl carrier protein